MFTNIEVVSIHKALAISMNFWYNFLAIYWSSLRITHLNINFIGLNVILCCHFFVDIIFVLQQTFSGCQYVLTWYNRATAEHIFVAFVLIMYEDFPWVFVMTWLAACRAKNSVKIIDNNLFIYSYYLGAVHILLTSHMKQAWPSIFLTLKVWILCLKDWLKNPDSWIC